MGSTSSAGATTKVTIPVVAASGNADTVARAQRGLTALTRTVQADNRALHIGSKDGRVGKMMILPETVKLKEPWRWKALREVQDHGTVVAIYWATEGWGLLGSLEAEERGKEVVLRPIAFWSRTLNAAQCN